jgi:hypothetical protein
LNGTRFTDLLTELSGCLCRIVDRLELVLEEGLPLEGVCDRVSDFTDQTTDATTCGSNGVPDHFTNSRSGREPVVVDPETRKTRLDGLRASNIMHPLGESVVEAGDSV